MSWSGAGYFFSVAGPWRFYGRKFGLNLGKFSSVRAPFWLLISLSSTLVVELVAGAPLIWQEAKPMRTMKSINILNFLTMISWTWDFIKYIMIFSAKNSIYISLLQSNKLELSILPQISRYLPSSMASKSLPSIGVADFYFLRWLSAYIPIFIRRADSVQIASSTGQIFTFRLGLMEEANQENQKLLMEGDIPRRRIRLWLSK